MSPKTGKKHPAPREHARSLPPLDRVVDIAIESRSPSLPTVQLAGARLNVITESGCVGHILAEMDHGRGGWVITPNLDHLRRMWRDEAFAELCTQASLCVADGMPLIWACALQGTPLPERVAGSNLISSLSAGAAAAGRSIFLLGGDPGTAQAAAEVLRARHPELRIAGTYCPDVGFEHDAKQMEEMTSLVETTRPDIVFVALGSPKQEHLIEVLRDRLPSVWWLGVGISFSFLCGEVTRAPKWMQRTGLEWTHRLIQEPRRLARRYLVQGIPSAAYLLASSAWRRGRRVSANR